MRPTRRALLFFVALLPVALLPVFFGSGLWVVWTATLGLAALVAGGDAVLAPAARRVKTKVDLPDSLFIGEEGEMSIELWSPTATEFELLVEFEGEFRDQHSSQIRVGKGQTVTTTVALVPRRRGTSTVRAIWLRWAGPVGLMSRRKRVDVSRDVAVIPNIGAVRQTALRFFSQREYLSGLKVERYVGDGTEFESMRDYVPGLNHRAMNWKASARHRRLIVEEFRAERNHQIMIAIDSGHLMADELNGIPKLDHSINAALQLAYVGLRTGDRVGWFTFDDGVRSFAQPEGGVRTFRRLQTATAAIEYSNSETNFTLALSELSQRLRRRSLVVVLSDFVDTVTAELMLENLTRLSRRHLVLFVTLRDPTLDATAAAAPDSLRHLYRSVVSADFTRERDLVMRRLRRLGVQCLDSAPNQITAGLLNQYLHLKRREQF